jgi:hypothetical protein
MVGISGSGARTMGDKPVPHAAAWLPVLAALAVAGCGAPAGEDSVQDDAAAEGEASANGPTVSGDLPLQVDLPTPANGVLEFRPNFDAFSWQSFIALNWPVDPNARGAPHNPNDPQTFLKAGGSFPNVWGSFREAYELYTGATRPVPFDGPDPAAPSCGGAGSGRRALIMSSKVGTVLKDGDEAFSFPLVDQGNNYIYYEVRLNRDQYSFVRGADTDRSTWLYRAVNLMRAEQRGPVSMPLPSTQPYRQGAVMVKAAWKQMTPADDPKRYFTQQVQICDTTGPAPAYRDVTVGLIGLHIAHKVARFPEWVWSSFEHVDNVPPDSGPPPPRMTLNNGTDIPKTIGGWANRPASQQPTANRSPTQATRFNPIPTTPAKVPGSIWPNGAGNTVDINAAYQALLAGTVWANYQLVITQWPANPGTFKIKEDGGVYPSGAGTPFPANGAVNTSMETYFQSPRDAVGAGGNSCMQCHYGAGQSDFSWSLTLRAN